MGDCRVTVMGSFVADLAFRTPRLPGWGETVMGTAFRLGPGGKGSNQAVAAARLSGGVVFISKLGRDGFGELARRTYADALVQAEVAPFFRDMAGRLAAAHLVIGRSGASTVCELAVAGRPSILGPRKISLE